jgi:hypothetical protein
MRREISHAANVSYRNLTALQLLLLKLLLLLLLQSLYNRLKAQPQYTPIITDAKKRGPESVLSPSLCSGGSGFFEPTPCHDLTKYHTIKETRFVKNQSNHQTCAQPSYRLFDAQIKCLHARR